MNNFKKIGLSALAGSLVAFSANAGELTASGTTNLFVTNGAKNAKTTVSMGNSVTFSGTTELDNGFEVTYSVEFDGDEGDQGDDHFQEDEDPCRNRCPQEGGRKTAGPRTCTGPDREGLRFGIDHEARW